MARGVKKGKYQLESLDQVVLNSTGHLESVWNGASNPCSNESNTKKWAECVRDTTKSLIMSFINKREMFEQYSRIQRRWDDWGSPEE
ncbi:MAG: hypothetical protein Tsb009_26200 [Planctomycetaceae bacterium]